MTLVLPDPDRARPVRAGDTPSATIVAPSTLTVDDLRGILARHHPGSTVVLLPVQFVRELLAALDDR